MEHALGALVGPNLRNSAADASGRPGVHLEASKNRLLGRVHDHRFSLSKIWFWEHEVAARGRRILKIVLWPQRRAYFRIASFSRKMFATTKSVFFYAKANYSIDNKHVLCFKALFKGFLSF